MNPSKRDILLALTALGLSAATPALAQQSAAQNLAAGRAIGAAYLSAHPNTDVTALRRTLMPDGFSTGAAQALRARVSADFRDGRVFIYKGWRLSETEAQVFALLT